MRQPPQREILAELAMLALESDSRGIKFDYSDEDFLNALIIFNSALGSKFFDLAKKEGHPFETQLKEAERLGEELRILIYTFTNIDTHEISKK